MSWFTKTFSSTIGQKILVALTGLFLCLFLVVHLIGNLQLLKSDDGYAFNAYAKFMTSNPLIMIASYVTYFAILFHAFKGIQLAVRNRRARPVGYRNAPKSRTSGFSRSMALLGTIIFVFILIHMQQFWYEYKWGEKVKHTKYVEFMDAETKEPVTITQARLDSLTSHMEDAGNQSAIEGLQKDFTYSQEVNVVSAIEYKDLYVMVIKTFKDPLFVLLYVISMIAIAFHLFHGFKSAFQTMGWNHSKYNSLIKGLGTGFAVIIPALFALIPLYIYFN